MSSVKTSPDSAFSSSSGIGMCWFCLVNVRRGWLVCVARICSWYWMPYGLFWCAFFVPMWMEKVCLMTRLQRWQEQHDQIINHHHTSCMEFGLNKEFGLHSSLSVFVQLWPCVFICWCCWTCASSGLMCVCEYHTIHSQACSWCYYCHKIKDLQSSIHLQKINTDFHLQFHCDFHSLLCCLE